MKIIVAPQSFKGSLSAKDASNIISQSVSEIFPEAEIVQIPIADGGDGTLETIIDATDGQIMTTNVTGPLNDNINAPCDFYIPTICQISSHSWQFLLVHQHTGWNRRDDVVALVWICFHVCVHARIWACFFFRFGDTVF